MKLVSVSSQAFNIVIAGAWNPAIFTPEWLKEFVASDSSGDVVLSVSFSPPNISSRLSLGGINLYPSPSSLSIDCDQGFNEGSDKIIEVISKLCDSLPHTPITAFGVNFRYVGELAESDVLSEIFSFIDYSKIDSRKFGIEASQISRAFNMDGGGKLNLGLALQGSTVNCEFNFHYDVRRLEDVSRELSAQMISDLFGVSKYFLTNVYSLSVEE